MSHNSGFPGWSSHYCFVGLPHVAEGVETVSETLARETVDVERIPVGRVVEARPEVRQEGDVTIVPVVEERLVVRKELVLTEEIRLTRRRDTEAIEQAHTVRRERAEVTRHPARASG